MYSCAGCGFAASKWMGFCPRCRTEEALAESPDVGDGGEPRDVTALSEAGESAPARLQTGLGEVDRVLGGGVVPGGVVLLGGEPGVGKSTLLLQMAGALAAMGEATLIVSAEESTGQVALRASRLAVNDDRVLLTAEPDVDDIIATAARVGPALLVVDSIQTVTASGVTGAPGGVAQVREAVARLIQFAKRSCVPTVLVGHVTKDGGIAGPKLVEHAVDVVCYLEGDPERGLRVLRCMKNRFGATHQIGLFEIGEGGLAEVIDPAGLLAATGLGEVPGSVVFPAVEGRRSLLVEVQALVAESGLAQPRRSVKGLDPARIHQIIAVLERHAGLSFAGRDVYVSVVGGLRVRDPGVDLPVALALASSRLARPTGALAAWGEVGLTGEVRVVAHETQRRAEAERLGLDTVVGPAAAGKLRIGPVLAWAGLEMPLRAISEMV